MPGVYNITEQEIEGLTVILEEYADAVINKRAEFIDKNTTRLEHDNDYYRIYKLLKKMLYLNVSGFSVENGYSKIEDAYLELLAILNNRKSYNRITTLVDTMLSLGKEETIKVIEALNSSEEANTMNVYDRIDEAYEIVSLYERINKDAKQKRNISR